MAHNTNVISIAPNQAAPSTRTTSQSTQPKYKPAARQGKRNFSATLDKVNAKLDELKQSVQDLQDTTKKLEQAEADAKQFDAATDTKAQGKSDKPQDAPQATGNDSEAVAEEEVIPADIFFNADKSSGKIKNSADVKASATTVEIPDTTADETTAPADEQPTENFLAANNMAYLFGVNTETLLATKNVEAPTTDPVAKVEGVQEIVPAQNLMTLMPQNDSSNAQSMLNMLGGRSWRQLDTAKTTQPVEVQQPVQQTTQPVEVQQPVQSTTQLVELQQTVQQTTQLVELQQTVQQTTQPVEVQQQVQSTTQPVEVQQPLQQTTQPVEVQQPVQSTTQPVEVQQPVQSATQPVEVQQPVQSATQPVEVQQPIQSTTQPVEVQQPIQQTTQPVEVQQPIQQTTQPVEVQQAVQSTRQPVEVQQAVQSTRQPVEVQQPVQSTTQPVEVQQAVQSTTQPVEVQQPVQSTTQPVEVQQPLQQTTQPIEVQQPVQSTTQPVEVQQPVQSTTQPVEIQQPIQQTTQPVEVQQAVQSTTQPVEVQQPVQSTTQPVEIQQPVQSTTQPVEVQQPVQSTTQPVELQQAVQSTTQPVEVQQPVQSTTQPVDAQAQVQTEAQVQPVAVQPRTTEQPAQNLSDLLGVNVQVEDAPTSAPVTPPQSTPQQFEQDNQQGAQNFQGQLLQATTGDETQPQQISTGGEIFAANLAATSDTQQSQPITPTQAPDAPPPTPEDFDVPAQIVRQARLIRTTENTEMVIKLNPEHLGELTLRISVSQNGAVNASFHSDNAQVRTIIENSLVQLRQELNNQGLKVENVQVYAGLSDGGLMNGQGGQAWQQNRQQRQGNRRIDFDSLERDVDATSPVNENSATDGVDYSV